MDSLRHNNAQLTNIKFITGKKNRCDWGIPYSQRQVFITIKSNKYIHIFRNITPYFQLLPSNDTNALYMVQKMGLDSECLFHLH